MVAEIPTMAVGSGVESWQEAVARLKLAPHPEGGFFRETFRSETGEDGRPARTSILFLLPEGQFSAFHRLDASEEWIHLEGVPVRLWILDGNRLSQAFLGGPEGLVSTVIPPGSWQAAEPIGGWALCRCDVTPGFVYEGFELAKADTLEKVIPDQGELIRRLTR